MQRFSLEGNFIKDSNRFEPAGGKPSGTPFGWELHNVQNLLNIRVFAFPASQIIRDVAFRGKSFPFVKPAIKGFPFREAT